LAEKLLIPFTAPEKSEENAKIVLPDHYILCILFTRHQDMVFFPKST
jgi:hypothetical protein